MRAIILMMDSFGVGAAEDASPADKGANTLGHIVKKCAEANFTRGPLQLPNLARLGLQKLAEMSASRLAHDLGYQGEIQGAYGYAAEKSLGKDTPSGHWEMAGVPVMFEWGYFPTTENCFPQELVDELIKQAKLPGVLGCKHASGTTIIDELGDEHIKTGKPILYTSADSVFQIACHEQAFGLERLYEICYIARKLVDKYNIGRVIARPFIGSSGNYKRTANRKDLAVLPPDKTLLDLLKAAGGEVVSVGKIADIYAHQGITQKIKGENNDELFTKTLEALKTAKDNSLIFTNFVDFDSSFGHRRNVAGYADALEAFDKRLPEIEKLLKPGDIVLITADHGCDPTWPGSDHTREHVPVIFFGPEVKPGNLGKRETFADMGQTLAAHFNLPRLKFGKACEVL
jgi:phosphopentomutase